MHRNPKTDLKYSDCELFYRNRFPYCSGEKKLSGVSEKMRFKSEVLAGRGEVLISIRLLVASCQTIRTPIRTNQATSCSPPPPFLFAFYPPTPLIDVDRCLCLQLSKLCKNVQNVGLILLLQPVSPRQDNARGLPSNPEVSKTSF